MANVGKRPYVKKLGKGFQTGKFAYRTPEENYQRDTLLRNNRVPKLEEENKSLVLDTSILNGLDHSKYSSEQKVAAATYYALTGNLTLAADKAQIPGDLIRQWKTRSTWFMDLVNQVYDQKMDEFNAKATAIIDDCLEELVDRVRKGEDVVISNGKIVKKNISARDLTFVTATLGDKVRLNQGKATSIRKTSSDDMLKKLKTEFTKMAGKTIEGERVDGE